MLMVAPTSIPITTTSTTTTFVTPFLVTSMSHRIAKASAGARHQINFSPITLSSQWSSMARLLILASLSVIGSIGNVFMISSVMIEDHLKKAGKYELRR